MNEPPTQSRKLAKAQRVVEARQRGAQTLSDTASCRACRRPVGLDLGINTFIRFRDPSGSGRRSSLDRSVEPIPIYCRTRTRLGWKAWQEPNKNLKSVFAHPTLSNMRDCAPPVSSRVQSRRRAHTPTAALAAGSSERV